MATGGGRAGTGYIEIRPELVQDFSKDLQRSVDRKVGQGVEVPVDPDTEGGAEKTAKGVNSWVGDAAIGGAGAAVGAYAGKFIMDGISSWIEEDKATARIAAALGLSPEGRQAVEQGARDVFERGLGGSLEDAQASMEAVLSTFGGGSYDDIVNMASAAQTLADTFGVDVLQATSVAGQMAEEFGLTGMQSFDMLAASMQGVDANLRGDLLEAIEEYAPQLLEMGYSADEAFAVFKTAAAEGKYELDKIPDAIGEMRKRMADFQDAPSNDALAALGLDPVDIKTRIAAGGESARSAMDDVINQLMAKKNDPRVKEFAAGIFGTQFEDLAQLDTLTLLQPLDNALGQTAGKAQELERQLTDSTSGAFDRNMRSMETSWNAGLDRFVAAPGESLGALVDQFENNFQGLWQRAQQWAVDMGTVIGDFFVRQVPAYLAEAVLKVQQWLGEFPGYLGGLWENIEDFFGKVPEFFGGLFDSIEELLLGPLKGAWNNVASFLMDTVQIPELGPWSIEAFGRSVDIGPFGPFDPFPAGSIPTFDSGGVVGGGRIGDPKLVMAHVGETILPTHKPENAGMGGSGVNISMDVSGVTSPAEVAEVAAQRLYRKFQAAVA